MMNTPKGRNLIRQATAMAFTLVELLVVIAIIGILAALIMPALSRAKANGQRTACLNNLTQIAKGVHMYAGDFNEILFPVTNLSHFSYYEWTAYDPFMRGYAGLNGAPSPQDKLFACPADTFYYGSLNSRTDWTLIPQSEHLQSNNSFSSYAFNAGNAAFRGPKPPFPGMFPGIMGSKLSSISVPAKTVLVAEWPAFDGYSWHKPSSVVNNAPDMLSFADGHVAYVKMYYGSNNPSQTRQHPFAFNPPVGYDYQWSRD
jgi:prepilin-type N-terminal cleavage/methylation domain-containing protein